MRTGIHHADHLGRDRRTASDLPRVRDDGAARAGRAVHADAHTSNFADVAGFAANPIPFNREFGRKVARIVLVNATELEWHRATYRSQHCLFAPVDAQLLGLQSLQRWLWQRLSTPQNTGGHGVTPTEVVLSVSLPRPPARIPRAQLGGPHHAHVRQGGSQRSQRSRRQARRRGAPLRGWRARWPEADRIRRLGPARRRREERHLPGAPVHRPW